MGLFLAYNEQVISSTNPLHAVWMDKPVGAVQLAAVSIEEARLELWRRRVNIGCYREVLILARQRYKEKLGKVTIMPSEETKQTMMSDPPSAGELFVFTDGTLGTGEHDKETGEEIRTPNKILAYCVEVKPLPGGGGFGENGMYVVDYIERGKA